MFSFDHTKRKECMIFRKGSRKAKSQQLGTCIVGKIAVRFFLIGFAVGGGTKRKEMHVCWRYFEAHSCVQSVRARNTEIPNKNKLPFAFHC